MPDHLLLADHRDANPPLVGNISLTATNSNIEQDKNKRWKPGSSTKNRFLQPTPSKQRTQTPSLQTLVKKSLQKVMEIRTCKMKLFIAELRKYNMKTCNKCNSVS